MRVAVSRLTLPNGEWVMQRRRDDKKHYPGMLALFGGEVRVGEADLSAALREIREETSLRLGDSMLRWLHKSEFTDENAIEIEAVLFGTCLPTLTGRQYRDMQVNDGSREKYSLDQLMMRSGELTPIARVMVEWAVDLAREVG